MLSADSRPLSVAELERRIDVAIGVARAAEEAALEIGAASLEAAEQARRAAVLAERASEASQAAARFAAAREPARPSTPAANQSDPVGRATRVVTMPAAPLRPIGQPDPFDERMVAFRQRAEKVMARLRRLEVATPIS
jgi:hypothetical protein